MSSPSAVASPPPIAQVVPYLRSALSVTSTLVSAAISLVSRLSGPYLFLLIAPLLYVFAPLVVFFQIIYDIFVRVPISIAVYFLQALYPLYVFIGVACITGAILGLGSKYFATILVNLATQDNPQETSPEEELLDSEEEEEEEEDEEDETDYRGRSPHPRDIWRSKGKQWASSD